MVCVFDGGVWFLAGEGQGTVGGADVVGAVPVDARVWVSGDQADEPLVDRGDREGLVLDPRQGCFEERRRSLTSLMGT